MKQLEEFFQRRIRVAQVTPNKYAVSFPMYKIADNKDETPKLYEIYLISENGGFFLSDEGTTYADLDKIFELKEPDVIKNLIAILKRYGCRKQQGTNAFIIECTPQDIHIKMSHLIQAISFMLNMKIFYV